MEFDNSLNSIILCITEELQRAERKHPEWPTDPVHAAAILSEESGELVRSVLRWNYENKSFFEMQDEAIQVGAMAVRFLLNLDYYKKTKPQTVARANNGRN
jgi:NTP pyrophosphatase (non-canonical NTP hydrolase)